MSDILNDERLSGAGGRRKAEERPQAGKLSMEDRVAAARKNFSAQWNQASIPQILNDPDWHYCWLSTTNSYDPIHQRMSLGYEPVKPDDVHGKLSFSAVPAASGEFAGCVSMKEMVLFRIPKEIYQVAMEEMHHHEPMRMEQALKETYDSLASGRDSGGRALGRDMGDGINDLGRGPAKTPVFE